MIDRHAAGSLLEALRLSRDLTQSQLSKVAGVPQATISKAESALVDLDESRWGQLASALGVPVDAFWSARPPRAAAQERLFHRKRKTTPLGEVKRIGATIALIRRRLDDLLELPGTSLRRYDLEDGFVTPQEVAQRLRRDLDLGLGPIENLIAVVEDAGAVVIRWPLDGIHVDAIASWPEEGVPVILIGEHVPAERMRFTVAHEIGHAVMHNRESDEGQERQADAFAAEFLFPRSEVLREWPSRLNLESLIALKRKWGVSLSALIRRGVDTGVIEDNDYRAWSIELSRTGMHRREPDPIEAERPRRLSAVVEDLLGRGATLEELASRTHMLPDEFAATFLEGTR